MTNKEVIFFIVLISICFTGVFMLFNRLIEVVTILHKQRQEIELLIQFTEKSTKLAEQSQKRIEELEREQRVLLKSFIK